MLRGRQALSLISVLVVGSIGCHRSGQKGDLNVVATVDGVVLTRSAFEKELQRELATFEDSATSLSPEQLQIMRQTLVDRWVERTLLLGDAKRKGITVPPAAVAAGMARISADFADDGGFARTLQEGQVGLPELKQKTEDLLVIEKLFAQEVYARTAATEAEINQYYEAHHADFDQPEEVRMRQIVVNSRGEAAKILAELQAGAKFEEVAKKRSLSADAKVGGDLGFFPRGVMPALFDEWAFRLGPGEMSDVVPSDYGFHIFKVLEQKPPQKRSLADVRTKVEALLLESKRRSAQQAYLAALRAKAQIRVESAALLNASNQPPVVKGK